MSVAIMTANRPQFSSKDLAVGSTESKAAATETYMSYCGQYEIQDSKVIHHIEGSLFPNWVGVDQERFFEFTENQLSLSTPPLMIRDKQQTGHLIWKRVAKA